MQDFLPRDKDSFMTKKHMIRAIEREQLAQPPIWMMRQAGRYLPEYQEVKEKAGGFLGLCKIPEFGVEVTLQPLRRYGFDAAILFSDILIPAEPMGFELNFDPGPIIANPVRNRKDVDALRIPEPDESLGFVLDILRILKKELPRETTLIGFAGTPYTLASYLVDESQRRGFETLRQMFYREPGLAHDLLDKITEMTVRYLRAQIDAGADVVQLFDSSAGFLTPRLYGEFTLSYTKKVIEGLRDKSVPLIYFAPGAMLCLEEMQQLGADVIGIDFRISLARAREILGDSVVVQGNLDPAALLGTPDAVRGAVRTVLEENGGRPGHIFNLGHGVLPGTPPANVEAMVDEVRRGN